MNALKLEELEEGNIYWCRLAERPVLVTYKNEIGGTLYVKGLVYTEGGYENIDIYNYQLKENK